MNYVKLKAEVTGDPLARGYAGMTDQQVADSLNAVDRTVKNPVQLRDLIIYLLKNGRWEGIETEAASGTTVKAQCKAFMVVMSNPNFSDLDLTDTTVRAMLLAIKDAGLLNAADQTAILTMADQSVSRARELGLTGTWFGGDIAAKDVARVR